MIEWIIRNQFGRRNLSAYERTKLALRLEGVIAGRGRQGERTDICQKSDNSEPLDTKREIAKAAGVSHDTVAKVKKIEAKANQSAGGGAVPQKSAEPVDTRQEIAKAADTSTGSTGRAQHAVRWEGSHS